MKTITINNKSEVSAEGDLSCYRCKPVIRTNPLKIYTSVTDAAADAGCCAETMIRHLKGKIPTCKGKVYKYLSDRDECWELVMNSVAALQADADKWRAQEAEQEAVRMAEEKRLADIAKAEEEKYHQKYLAALSKRDDAINRARILRAE